MKSKLIKFPLPSLLMILLNVGDWVIGIAVVALLFKSHFVGEALYLITAFLIFSYGIPMGRRS